jgi:hypothetical protein
MRATKLMLLTIGLSGCALASHGVDQADNPGGNLPSAKIGEWFDGKPATLFPVALGASSIANGQDANTGRCEYSVTFSGAPTETSKNVVEDSSSNYKYSQTYQADKYEEVFSCSCFDKAGLTPSNITKSQSYFNTEKSLSQADYKIVNSLFTETSPLGKVAEYEALSQSVWGELVLRLRIYYRQQCLLAVGSAHVRGNADTSRAIAFLNSVRKAVPQQVVPSIAPNGTDASSRLQGLKQLLDQKLITPAEYGAKRQSIIDGM